MWMGFRRALVTLTSGLLLTAPAAAKTLLVSDIDDTIKVSHILNWGGKLGRAADVTTPFRGMSDLYRLISRESASVIYLSNAPREIAGIPALEVSHKTFLSLNGFPYGPVLLRGDLRNPHHKITELRRLMRAERPDTVILIGDNGEKDPEVYNQFYREFGSQARVLTFIHQLYSTDAPRLVPGFLAEVGARLYPEQVGFVTPVEVALELRDQALLSPAAAAWMVTHVASAVVREPRLKWDGLRAVSFPFFKKCADFRWRWPLTPDILPLHEKISSVCR